MIRPARPLVIHADYRLGGRLRGLCLPEGETPVQIPDEIRKCVCFLGVQRKETKSYSATGFFVGVPFAERQRFVTYLITARHVIEEAKKRSVDGKLLMRVNSFGGNYIEVAIPLDEWHYHPDPWTDVAALWVKIAEDAADFLLLPADMMLDDYRSRTEGIGVGDEVFLTGIFTKHYGKQRNVPIVRAGTIAAMPDEPVRTQMGDMLAYLVETRSIGGLSGSPVFVYLPPLRQGPTALPHASPRFYLLGVMHGHWDSMDIATDVAADARNELNTGIAVVVPSRALRELLDQPQFVAEREVLAAQYHAENTPKMDLPPLPHPPPP